MDEQNRHIPSREETEAKMQGRDVDFENLPDREIAERNSPYKLAQEAQEKWGKDYEQEEQANTVAGGRGNTGGSTKIAPAQGGNRQQMRQSQPGQSDDQTYQDSLDPNLQKENRLHETVSLDTDPYAGPSKLDTVS